MSIRIKQKLISRRTTFWTNTFFSARIKKFEGFKDEGGNNSVRNVHRQSINQSCLHCIVWKRRRCLYFIHTRLLLSHAKTLINSIRLLGYAVNYFQIQAEIGKPFLSRIYKNFVLISYSRFVLIVLFCKISKYWNCCRAIFCAKSKFNLSKCNYFKVFIKFILILLIPNCNKTFLQNTW